MNEKTAVIIVIGWFALIIVGLRSEKPYVNFIAILMIMATIVAIIVALS